MRLKDYSKRLDYTAKIHVALIVCFECALFAENFSQYLVSMEISEILRSFVHLFISDKL